MKVIHSNSEHAEPTPFPIADERRATVQAMNAWTAARGESKLPDFAILFDGSRRLGDSEFLIKIDVDILDSVFVVCGDKFALPLGERGFSKPTSPATDPALYDMFREACIESVRDRVVVYREGAAMTAPGTAIGYRCNFMPLRSGNDVRSMYVFGAFGTKTYPESARAVA